MIEYLRSHKRDWSHRELGWFGHHFSCDPTGTLYCLQDRQVVANGVVLVRYDKERKRNDVVNYLTADGIEYLALIDWYRPNTPWYLYLTGRTWRQVQPLYL